MLWRGLSAPAAPLNHGLQALNHLLCHGPLFRLHVQAIFHQLYRLLWSLLWHPAKMTSSHNDITAVVHTAMAEGHLLHNDVYALSTFFWKDEVRLQLLQQSF